MKQEFKNSKKKIKLIISKRNDAIGICNEYLNKYMNKYPIEIISLNRKFGIFSEFLNFIYLFFKLKRNDNVFFTDPYEMVTNIVFFKKLNTISICHHIDGEPRYYNFFFGIFSIKKLLNKFIKIIAISEFTKNQLIQLGIKNSKIKVVYWGLDNNIFFSNKIKLCYKYILVVGSEIPRKNMKNILLTFSKLLKKYPNLKLVKFGRVNSKNREITFKYLEKYNIKKNQIVFYDNGSLEDLVKFYSSAEFLLFPSLLEGFGMPIVEAMGCGCPVVTSDIPPMSELQTNKNLLVNPYDIDSIYSVCNLLLSNQSLKKESINLGFKRVKDFNWESTCEKIWKIFENIY